MEDCIRTKFLYNSKRMQKTLGFARTSGQDYEVALCCLFFLRALRLSRDFFLVSNHAQAGKFDDVVLFYRLKDDQGDKYRAILLQAKHKENITKKKLTASNPFRLKEYLESFKVVRRLSEQPLSVESRLIELQELSLVLYTNSGCEIGEAAVDVTNVPEARHLQDFLNTGGGRLLRISEARRVGLPEGEETSAFLSHLLLCTEQMSVETADSVLEEELSSALKLTSPAVARNLKTELKRVVRVWWGEGTLRCLTTRSREWRKVLQTEITRLNSDTATIHDLEFTKARLEDVLHRRFKLNWVSVRDEFQATAVRTRLFRAQKNSLFVSVSSLNNHFSEVEALWRSKICSTLVFDVTKGSPEEGSPTLLRRLQELVQGDAGRRLVVIATVKPTGGRWRQVEAEPTWSVLRQVTRDRLLEAPVRLQGEAVALRDVVGPHVGDVMSDQVISSVWEMELGAAMPAPLEYDLPRCLQRTSTKTVSVDTLTNTNMLIFPSNCLLPENEFTKRLKCFNKYEVNRITAIKHPTIVEGITNDYDIRKLCCRFRVQGISGEMKGLPGYVTEFIPFTWICEEKIVVIEGPPGVGKSSFVTAMCSAVKEQFSEAWVLRLNMGQHADYIKETDFTNVSRIQEFLLKGLIKDPNNLERRLLEHSLGVTGNVFLFLDAFDEISPDFTSKCCDLLEGIAQTTRYRQMVVTTRPVTTQRIEEVLQTETFTLPVYSEEEQVLFLEKFLGSRGNHIGEEGISSLRRSAGPALEIPLLCRMAAEVFMHSREQLFLKCQNPWRRVSLYKLFVEQIVIDHHAEKFGMEVSVPGIRKLLEYSSNLHLQNLQGLAVRKLMSADQLPPLPVPTDAPEEKFGLVVSAGGRVDFEHQTFAEYFLGCWLACHWQLCPRKLLRDVLFRDGFEFVAATLSWSLLDGDPLHLAVAHGDEVSVREHLAPGTTRGGRSALHVAAMTRGHHRKVWELLVTSGEDLNAKDDVLGTAAVKYAEMIGNWEFVDFCLEERANVTEMKFHTVQKAVAEVLLHAVQKDLVWLCRFIWRRCPNINLPLLHLAAANNSIRVIRFLIEMHEMDEIDESGLTPLHEASRRGHVDAVALMLAGGARVDVEAEDGDTAVSLAAQGGHLEVLKMLLENGADVNVKNRYGCTALTGAARGGRLEVVKMLLEKGADVNLKTEDGKTAFSLAAREGRLQVLKMLLDDGADLNVKTEDGNTAVTLATCEGHLEVLKILLHNGADVNMKNKYGYTALTEAARRGYLEVVRMLLEKRAELNVKTEDKNTAFTLAAREGHLEVVKMLLENGASVNVKNRYGHTALTEAAREGRLQVVKMLLEKGADVNMRNKYGYAALAEAARRGYLQVVKVLLDKGADLNIKTEDGSTVLTEAVRQGHLEAVKILLEKGADVNTKNKHGETAFTLAACEGHLEVVKMLLEKIPELSIKTEDGDTALTEAAGEGRLQVVKLLLEKGADVNVKNKNGYAALTEAARGGHLQMVRMLLEKGADVNIKNKFGYTALTLAATRGHLEVVKVLLEERADLTVKTVTDNSALTLAATRGHLEVVKVLIEKGVDLNLKTATGNSALTLAATRGHLEVVKVLLEKGADLNLKTVTGNTALMLTAREGHLKVLKMLLEKAADLNRKNKFMDTALMMAAREGHLETVKILIEKGADVNIKSDYGDTALTRAARGGHLEVVKALLEGGADVNVKTATGNTAVTLAARRGHLEVEKMLLEKGAQVNFNPRESGKRCILL